MIFKSPLGAVVVNSTCFPNAVGIPSKWAHRSIKHADAVRELDGVRCLSDEQRQEYLDDEPLCFGHTLRDQLGGQIDAGLAITGMFEDRWSEWPIPKHIPNFMATKATKLS